MLKRSCAILTHTHYLAIYFCLSQFLVFTPHAYSEVAEKHAIFYPTFGYQKDISLAEENGNNSEYEWVIPFRVWVSEPMDLARLSVLKTARKLIEKNAGKDHLSETEKKRFKIRAQDFLRDSESRERISIRFVNDPEQITYRLSGKNQEHTTDRNGLLEGVFKLSSLRAKELLKAQESNDGWLKLKVISEDHYGEGKIQLISRHGLTVVSDIDDTIKVTNILNGNQEILDNTFFKPFEAAPKMAKLYQSFPEGTRFHYVSGGPWQLYRPLEVFLTGNGLFPAGSFHMKNVRTNLTESETYSDVKKLITGGATQEQKIEQITRLFNFFPERKFILIGDSGEHDPEIYRMIKNQFSESIKEVIIRDVKGDRSKDPERLEGFRLIH